MLDSMRNLRTIFPAFFIIMIGLTVSACGVKSSPEQPRGSNFPAAYPILEKTPLVNSEGVNRRFPTEHRSESPTGIYKYPNPPSYEPPKE